MPDSPAETLPIPLSPALTPAQMSALISLVRRCARAEIMPRFRDFKQAGVSVKTGPHDLVTDADIATEAMLARGLQTMFPHALVLGEEAVSADPRLRDRIAAAEMAFILDPLDGTWNFAHGLPLFGVIVAVTRFGHPVLGLLYDPVMDDWVIGDATAPTRMGRAVGTERRLRMAPGARLADMAGYVHLHLVPEDMQARLAACLPDFSRTSVLNCSCHEYRTLAQGGMQFCLSGVPNPWDHAAGVLACQQAGGVARMLDGRDYNAAITDGYVLTAPDADSWNRLRDRFAFLVA